MFPWPTFYTLVRQMCAKTFGMCRFLYGKVIKQRKKKRNGNYFCAKLRVVMFAQRMYNTYREMLECLKMCR